MENKLHIDHNILSQEEINSLKLDDLVDDKTHIINLIILIRNELNIIETDIDKIHESRHKKIIKKLNGLLDQVISLRK